MIHLTNDAVQKNNQSYGKFEDFNKVYNQFMKMNFNTFRRYLTKLGYPQTAFQNTYQKMKEIAYYLIASSCQKIKRKQYTFEVTLHLFSYLDWTLCLTVNWNPIL